MEAIQKVADKILRQDNQNAKSELDAAGSTGDVNGTQDPKSTKVCGFVCVCVCVCMCVCVQGVRACVGIGHFLLPVASWSPVCKLSKQLTQL